MEEAERNEQYLKKTLTSAKGLIKKSQLQQ